VWMLFSTAATNTISRKLIHNIALIGPPGSGKGSYGKILADQLPATLISTSDVIRNIACKGNENETIRAAIDSGSLLDDRMVSDALQSYLLLSSSSSSSSSSSNKLNAASKITLFDGFPRTIDQVKIMEETWPSDLKINAVINLEVPRKVCEMKLQGRRRCKTCGQSVNIADVNHQVEANFVLPPVLCSCSSPSYVITREDDRCPDVMKKRLDLYYSLTIPILEHFETSGLLLRFTPFKGYLDMPRFEESVRDWLDAGFVAPSSL